MNSVPHDFSDKVTVVIPTYNDGEKIVTALRSVLGQTYNNIEVIVVDDGSANSVSSLFEKNQIKDKRIKIITKKNGGVSSARNAGIKKATGKYLFFLDADDYIDKKVIENLVLKAVDRTRLVGCKIKVVSNDGSWILERKLAYSKDEFYRGILNNELQGFCWGYLFDAKICRKILFDQSLAYCEDLVFVSKYIEVARIDNIYFAQGILHYVQNLNGVTLSKSKLFKNLYSMQIALGLFNGITNLVYEKQINNKLIALYESELQKASSFREYKAIFEEFKLPRYQGPSLRYKFFAFFYRYKLSLMMVSYYKARRMAKGLKRNNS